MSKIVKVWDGDYKVVVQAGGNITLDTGDRIGIVTVTGDLNVQGAVTYIESTNTSINDNILLLNRQEPTNADPYVILQYSGIEIDRGQGKDGGNTTYGNVQIVYDEKTNIDGDGTIRLRYTIGGTYVPLETDTITTGASENDLTLYPGLTGVVGVFGTVDYKDRVIDPNAIPNKDYVDTSIVTYLSTFFPPILGAGATRVTTQETPTHEIGFILNNALKARINSSGFTIDGDLNLSSNVISNLDATSNLKLTATNGSIELNGYVIFNNKSSVPSATTGANTVYSLGASPLVSPTVGPGDTGLYFVNTTKSDELVSKNRALLWSMLF